MFRVKYGKVIHKMKQSTATAISAILATDPSIPTEYRDLALQVLRDGLPTAPAANRPLCYRPSVAASVLGVSTRTLRSWEKSGKLTGLKVHGNRTTAYTAASVEALAGKV